ncbi:hypothetical protein JHK82_022318 [Glycine max]|uniref:Uncharacterized protein n=1 Tax=Glycine soja TaxID=3848 RepID=A0A0B2PTW3_GLYSO|nr:hypothetical protein JHK85_022803 [Glycine max]KAG5026426.1 hypothetical protein JHK86_022340 [Glycine max]KAG5137587.1 hypothetical protein JHK82_022318 [Glycine max]KAH1238430.1 hypothetical protein GmHk_08G023092 [Glycine max]KHN11178.1 hypothetical protein glysoja_049879 [Glycine soja]
MGEKESEKLIWEQMRTPTVATPITPQHPTLPKLLVLLILFFFVTYIIYTLKLVSTSRTCKDTLFSTDTFSKTIIAVNAIASAIAVLKRGSRETNLEDRTNLFHLVFGIAASTKLWDQRKSYIKL